LKLDGFPLLDDLGANQRDLLREYLEARGLRAGQALFRTGEESGELFLIARGRVRIEAGGRAYGALGNGETLGALSLVAIGSRQCDAIAEDDALLLSLSREAYLRMRLEVPGIALAIQESILRRFTGAVRAVLDGVRNGTTPPNA
jgi:CRP-like cAMP-binding protein